MGLLSKKFDVFVFDWDGTLANLGPVSALNERYGPLWLYKKKRSRKTAQKIKSAKGVKAERYNIKEKMKARKVEGRIFGRFVDLYFFIVRPRLQRDSRAVLEELKKTGKTTCLLTNAASWRAMRALQKFGLEDYFEVIVSAQEIKAIKPNPLGLETIIRAIGARKERTIYIGDMIDDVMMAKYAGVHSCAIASGFSSYDKLKSIKPDYIFRSMEEFKKAL